MPEKTPIHREPGISGRTVKKTGINIFPTPVMDSSFAFRLRRGDGIIKSLLSEIITQNPSIGQSIRASAEKKNTQSNQTEPEYRFTPGEIPHDMSEITTYVREMIRRNEIPDFPSQRTPMMGQIKSGLDPKILTKRDIERISTVTTSILNTDTTFPVSQIINTAQEIIDDAVSLIDRGFTGDIVGMALNNPSIHYSYQPASYVHRMSRVNKTRKGTEVYVEESETLPIMVPVEPYEISTAREKLRSAITGGTSDRRIAQRVDSSVQDIRDFALGGNIDMSQSLHGNAISINDENKDAADFYKHINDLRWFRTLTHLEGVPLSRIAGTGLKLMRLSATRTQEDTVVGKGTQSAYERGKKIPLAFNLLKSIKDFGLDPQSKAAQYLLLFSLSEGNKPPSDKEKPMTSEVLKNCDLRVLLRYLRRLKGATIADVAKVVSYATQTYRVIEEGHSRQTMSESALEAYINWLELDTEGPLAWILRKKQKEQKSKQKKTIPDSVLHGAVNEQYLFQENIDSLGPYEYSNYEVNLKLQLETLIANRALYSQLLNALIGETTDLPGFARKAGIHLESLKKKLKQDTIPEDRIVLKIAAAKKIGPHNPLLHDLLQYAQELRAA